MERRKTPAQDRADVRVRHRAHHAFREAPGGFVGLHEEQAIHHFALGERLRGPREVFASSGQSRLGCPSG